MNFAPKTEKQLTEENLIKPGIYAFDVISAAQKSSRAGNDMIEIELRIFLEDGSSRKLKDYLLAALGFKLYHFCTLNGLSTQYTEGTVTAEDCIGRAGYVKISIRADKSGAYPDQNSVSDYVRPPMRKSEPRQMSPTEEQMANIAPSSAPAEDVPF